MPDLRPGVPRYQQIAGILRARIEDGTYPPGCRLPTETDLSHEYGVGRDTARKAMMEIRHAGLADAAGSRGTIVRMPEQLEQIRAARGSTIRSRMPRTEDRERWGDIPAGVPMLVVFDPAGRERDAYPADRFEVPIK